MDREALVIRNRKVAEAFHSTPIKHHVRHGMLRLIATMPISHGKQPPRERILLVRPDHLGDVLLTTPAIHALREAIPNAEIHVLIGPWSAKALANNNDIDAVITLDFPGFNRSGNDNLRSPYQLALHTARQLRKIHYSSAVILRPDHWWGAMVTFLAGIPQRIGHDMRDVKPFLTHPIHVEDNHVVLQSARLLEKWTRTTEPSQLHLTYTYTDEDRAYINSYLDEWGLNTQDRLFCIHPGAGTWVKLWNNESWAKVADILADQLEATPVITGTDSEVPLAREIAAQMSHEPIIIAGDTQVGQLAALFDRALVVLGPDSGPIHLAAAVDTPTVALFGPADPAEFAPWGSPQKHIILTGNIGCLPCRVLDWGSDSPENHPCVNQIKVGRVLEAARRVIDT